MRVLVVDDQPTKFHQAETMIQSSFPEAKIRHAKTFLSATSQIENLEWDLVVLDMAFSVNSSPSEFSGFEGAAGLQILQQIFREDIQTRVIIFTAHSGYEDPYQCIDSFDALKAHVAEFFAGICLGCIYSKDTASEIAREFAELTKSMR